MYFSFTNYETNFEFYITDIQSEILKLLLKKGNIPSLIFNAQQDFKNELIEKLEANGYENSDDLENLKTKADISKNLFEIPF